MSRESAKKITRSSGRASKKKTNDNNNNDYKVQTTTTICVSIGTRSKNHPLEPLEETKPKSSQCRHQYARKQTKEEVSSLKKCIEVEKTDLENRRRQIAQSVQEKVKETYGFPPDERCLEKQNALLILTTMEKWFYFYRPTNLSFHYLTIGKVSPKALQSLLGLGVKFYLTPLRPTLNIDKGMERFERDLHIWSLFAVSEDLMPLANTKIYIRSK